MAPRLPKRQNCWGRHCPSEKGIRIMENGKIKSKLEWLVIGKEILDLLGLAAFVKVFFGEKTAKKIEERIVADYRPKVLAAIFRLPLNRRKNLERRIREAQEAGTEDQLTYSLGKFVDGEQAQEILMWLDSLTPAEFKAMTDILDDDKLHQFLVRAQNFIKEHLGDNAKWHVEVERLQHNLEVWARREKAAAAARRKVTAFDRVLENPFRLLKLLVWMKP